MYNIFYITVHITVYSTVYRGILVGKVICVAPGHKSKNQIRDLVSFKKIFLNGFYRDVSEPFWDSTIDNLKS